MGANGNMLLTYGGTVLSGLVFVASHELISMKITSTLHDIS
jgi:hypothetical protein